MAISSIHIEAGKAGYFSHNSRESKTNNSIFSDEENYCSKDTKSSFELYKSELEIRTKAYTDRTGQKLNPKTITHLSSIVNFNQNHTPEDMQKVCDYLEKKLDTKVIQMAMHRDEGHIIEEDEEDLHNSIGVDKAIKNYHAHIEFMGLDSKGYSVRRKLDKPTLKQIQTDVANILGMERGRESGYSKEQYQKITNELKPQNDYETKKEYKKAFTEKAKELGLHNPVKKAKRLDTYDFKNAKESAKQTDLKKEITKLRAELKENGASREDYAKLEQLNRDLKERIKAKDLTIEELQSLVNNTEIFLESKTEELLKEKNRSQSLEEQKKTLEVKVCDLEEKIDSRPNMEEYEIYKQQYKIRNELIESFVEENDVKVDKNTLKNVFTWIKTKFQELKQTILDLKEENKQLKEENYELRKEVNRNLTKEIEISGSELEFNELEYLAYKKTDEFQESFEIACDNGTADIFISDLKKEFYKPKKLTPLQKIQEDYKRSQETTPEEEQEKVDDIYEKVLQQETTQTKVSKYR
jgi:hypothetical protein